MSNLIQYQTGKERRSSNFSQVGYAPGQEKVAVIELDKNDTPLKTASLFQVTQDGKFVEKLKRRSKTPGGNTSVTIIQNSTLAL